MIDIRDMSLSFGHDGRVLLRDVTLTVGDTEWVGLTGPSGGGKTLLGLVAAGVIPAIIRADIEGGVTVTGDTPQPGTAAAVVFQDPSFQLLARTVREELRYTPKKLGWPGAMVERDIDTIAAGLDIGHLLDRNPRELSMGEIQRVAVGTALIQRPRVLVMDEPTQYIDRYHVARTLEFTASWLADHPAAVVLIEHNIPLLRRFARRIFRVERGTVTPSDPMPVSFPPNSSPPSEPAGPCLSMRNVTFAYERSAPVLNGIDLDIVRGESVALLGPNGSGKSTLARIAAGLRTPGSGTVSVFGSPLRNGAMRHRIGFVMQNPDRQLFAPTVADECSFGPRNFGMDESRIAETVAAGLGEFGLTGFEERDPLSLSYGEKRRVNIVGVAAYGPDLIILDEPTTGLDFANQRILLDNIHRWAAAGKTVLVITHDIEFARAATRRAVFLERGEIIRDTGITRIREEDVAALYA